MKRYYLVKAKYDNERYPFRNQTVEAKSEEGAIEKYHEIWGNYDTDKLTSIEAEYLGISENVEVFIQNLIGKFYLLMIVPQYYYIKLCMYFQKDKDDL